MDTLRPYPAYKDSEVDWLGDVPEHWRVQRAKTLLSETNDRAGTEDLELLSLSKTRGILPQRMLSDRLASASDFSQYRRVEPGQLVMNRMQAWNGLFGNSPVQGMISPDYAVFNVNTEAAEVDYLLRLVRDPLWVQQFAALSTGVGTGFNRLYGEDLGTVPFLVPPLDEQRAIADFLDAMDASITRFLSARRRMIALLEEKKQAVINQAVTRGLDPDVPLKDSGVDWLGVIPSHWKTPQIGHFARVGNGSTPSRSNHEYWTTEGFPWLNSASVHAGLITSSDQFVTPRALDECHLPVVEPGDLLVAITGQGKTRGSAAIVGLTATINQHMAYIKIRSPKVFPRYLQQVLSAAYQTLRELSSDSGSTKGALTCADIRHFRAPIPPPAEQHLIVEHIDRETSRIDSLIDHHRREIELIQEYRIRLISDGVTGKLDVRGVELPPVEAVVGEEIEAAMEQDPLETEEITL